MTWIFLAVLFLILLLWCTWQLTRIANALTQVCDMMALGAMAEGVDPSNLEPGGGSQSSPRSPSGPFGFGGPT